MGTIFWGVLRGNNPSMALNFGGAPSSILLVPKHKHLFLKLYSSRPIIANQSSFFRAAAQSEGTEAGVSQENHPGFTGSLSSTRTQLDLLEQLTSTSSSGTGYESDENSPGLTIRHQLLLLVGDRDDREFSIPLGKNLKKVTPKFLTISQKRNIKRQAYLNEVSQRNDTFFFATIGAFVILPPILILGVAILNGYIQLFP